MKITTEEAVKAFEELTIEQKWLVKVLVDEMVRQDKVRKAREAQEHA